MAQVREFTTGWPNANPSDKDKHWQQRDDEEMLSALRRSSRSAPAFRPFDMLSEPNQSLALFGNADMRIGVESLVGTQPVFHRHVDFDTLWFQFSGRTSIESEQGCVDLAPGEMLVLPAGVAHRSRGSADALRLWAELRDPVEIDPDEASYQSHMEFRVERIGGPDAPTGELEASTLPAGTVLEYMRLWGQTDDEADIFERRYDRLIANSTDGRQLQKVRAFDLFRGITGKGRGPAPQLCHSSSFSAEAYNLDGVQQGFHRALRSEELALQFRGVGTTEDELSIEETPPGVMAWVPQGIAHRIVGREGFLRLVLYSHLPWQVLVDPRQHVHASSFQVQTTVHQRAAWMDEVTLPEPVLAGA